MSEGCKEINSAELELHDQKSSERPILILDALYDVKVTCKEEKGQDERIGASAKAQEEHQIK
jgi:hypothetical protein